MIIDYIRSHYEVRAKDIDPDTGEISKDWPIAITRSNASADMIIYALNKCSDEPNREFYIVYRDTIITC